MPEEEEKKPMGIGIKEGTRSKGGLNKVPTTSRPGRPKAQKVDRLELLSKIKVKVLANGFMETSEIDDIRHSEADGVGNSFKNHIIIAIEKLPVSSEIEVEIRRRVGQRKNNNAE